MVDFEQHHDGELWEVKRDGSQMGTGELLSLKCGDAQRGLVALTFALFDDVGWDFHGKYDELLWVRRCRPAPEAEPGQAIRVTVTRDLDAEREWAEGE